MTLRRGFKAEAERAATRLRLDLGLQPHDGLDPRVLAEHLEVEVVDADSLVPRRDLEELERLQAYAFSAATFEIAAQKIIVVNTLHALGRQNSDLAHELAHIILEHDLSELRELGGQPFRTCRPGEEEEATAFGGTILLPRALLMSAGRRNASIEQIASENRVTVDMARYRYNTTGVARQLAR